MRLLMMGPPGAGKGTQAAHLADWADVPAISTGDLLRANVADGTALGEQARRFMDLGEYVPDTVTNSMVRSRIAEPDALHGFLLDGYPRTLAQVVELDSMLQADGHELDAVVVLIADTDELVQRLLSRAAVQQRADDTAEVIRRRQEVYVEQTAPLLEVYGSRGLLVEVDGMGDVAEVRARLLSSLADATPTG